MEPEFLAFLTMISVNRKAFMPTVEAIKDKYYQIGHPGEQWQRQQLRWGWVDGGGRDNGDLLVFMNTIPIQE